jgi:hypothetical protein
MQKCNYCFPKNIFVGRESNLLTIFESIIHPIVKGKHKAKPRRGNAENAFADSFALELLIASESLPGTQYDSSAED